MLLSAISSKTFELQDMLLKHPDIDVHKSCPQTKMSPFKLAASMHYKPAVNKLLNHPHFDLSRELEGDKVHISLFLVSLHGKPCYVSVRSLRVLSAHFVLDGKML